MFAFKNNCSVNGFEAKTMEAAHVVIKSQMTSVAIEELW